MSVFKSLHKCIIYTFCPFKNVTYIYKTIQYLNAAHLFFSAWSQHKCLRKTNFYTSNSIRIHVYICPRAFSEPNVNSVSWFGRLREQPLPKSQTLLQFNTSNVTRLEHVLRKLVNYLEKSEIINHPAIPN